MLRQRVAVLIDYENVRLTCRGLFGRGGAPSWFGHVDPLRLARLLVGERTLAYTYVFRGEPDRSESPGDWEDFSQRRDTWRQAGVLVESTPVRYATEKGMDVALASELVLGAALDKYDVAVIVSGDNDFLTAIPRTRLLHREVEVAGWHSPPGGPGGAMMRAPAGVRRHRLDQPAFLRTAADPARTSRFMEDRVRPTAMRQALIDAGLVAAAAQAAA